MIMRILQSSILAGLRQFPVTSAFKTKANLVRTFSTTSTAGVKEILVQESGNNITVEGKFVESSRKDLIVKNPHADQNVCPLCALNLNLKHTDVLILSQFVRKDGCMLPRRVTGLCNRQQKVVQNLVAMAQKAGEGVGGCGRFVQPDSAIDFAPLQGRWASAVFLLSLMMNMTPEWSCKDPSKRFGSKKFNRYFDETTLRLYVDKHRKQKHNQTS